MLAPHEFSVGPVTNASGLTIVLRRGSGEASFLVTAAPGEPTAIFLDGEFRFAFMPSTGNTDWDGILIPKVAIEIDETSVLDENEGQTLGAAVRKHTQLFVIAKRDPRGRAGPVAVVADLPACHETQSAAFARWQIVLGEGTSKRVLMKINAREAAAPK